MNTILSHFVGFTYCSVKDLAVHIYFPDCMSLLTNLMIRPLD